VMLPSIIILAFHILVTVPAYLFLLQILLLNRKILIYLLDLNLNDNMDSHPLTVFGAAKCTKITNESFERTLMFFTVPCIFFRTSTGTGYPHFYKNR
jgi:hypothetical protein